MSMAEGQQPGGTVGRQPGGTVGRQPGGTVGRQPGGTVGRQPGGTAIRLASGIAPQGAGSPPGTEGLRNVRLERGEAVSSLVFFMTRLTGRRDWLTEKQAKRQLVVLVSYVALGLLVIVVAAWVSATSR